MSKKTKKPKFIGNYYGSANPNITQSPECMLRESFLRATRNCLDNFGIERSAIDEIRGGMNVLEEFISIKEELQ